MQNNEVKEILISLQDETSAGRVTGIRNERPKQKRRRIEGLYSGTNKDGYKNLSGLSGPPSLPLNLLTEPQHPGSPIRTISFKPFKVKL